MSHGFAFIIDPPRSLDIRHDTTLAMILECHRRCIPVAIIEPQQVFVKDAQVFSSVAWLKPTSDVEKWYQVTQKQESLALNYFDCVMMRKDPPCDLAYLHLTQMLSLAKKKGAYVVNDPDSLRLFNEKWLIEQFPDCIAPTLVSASPQHITAFIQEHQHVVLKPLDGMGGRGIFQVRQGDLNTAVIMETLLGSGARLIMAQKYLKEIDQGDKRILILHGQAFPYVLARKPAPGEFRGNLAAGGQGEVQPLSKKDQALVNRIHPFLVEHSLSFVGLDVIGDYITEINITSPTCVREIDALCQSNITDLLISGIIERMPKR